MWPTDFYSMGVAALERTGRFAISGVGADALGSVSTFERAGLAFGVVLVGALVVLGFVQEAGPTTVAKARRSPVISICIGLPAMLIGAGLTGTGYLLIGSSLGTAFGVPLVIVGGTLLPALVILGFVAIGHTLAVRLVGDRLWTGVLVGSLVAGLAGISLVTAAFAVVLAGSLGVGAGVRVLLGAGGVTQPDERTVPPANEI